MDYVYDPTPLSLFETDVSYLILSTWRRGLQLVEK
jgi:hypothetical protein